MKAIIVPRRIIPLLGYTFIFSSCSSTHRIGNQIDTNQQPVQVTEKVQLVDRWTPKLVLGSTRYLVVDSSTISMSSDSSHSSSINTTAIYNIVLGSLGDSFSLTAKVESLTTDSHLQASKTGSQLDSTDAFHATVTSNGRLSPITGFLPSGCLGGLSPAATRILELTISYPKQLKVGDEWTDSISTTSCRGKTVLQQHNLYHYKLTGFTSQNGRTLAQIQRDVLTSFHSLSTNPKNPLIAEGTGASNSILLTDQKTGMLVHGNEHSQIVLTVNTTRGSYPFTQNTSTQVELHQNK